MLNYHIYYRYPLHFYMNLKEQNKQLIYIGREMSSKQAQTKVRKSRLMHIPQRNTRAFILWFPISIQNYKRQLICTPHRTHRSQTRQKLESHHNITWSNLSTNILPIFILFFLIFYAWQHYT